MGKLTEKEIKAFEEKGWSRWTRETSRGTYDRLYINDDTLGLKASFYNTGNVSHAHLIDFENGEEEEMSHGQYNSRPITKIFVDVATGELHTSYDDRGYKKSSWIGSYLANNAKIIYHMIMRDLGHEYDSEYVLDEYPEAYLKAIA